MPTKPVTQQVLDRMWTGSSPFVQDKLRSAHNVQEVMEHPFLDLWTRPNPIMDGFEVRTLIGLYQELIGDAFLLKMRDKMGVIRGLWPLYGHMIKIIPSVTQFIDHYEYGDTTKPVRFEFGELVHFRFPSPASYYRGMSPLAAAASTVKLENNMERYEDAIFKNRARPDMVIIPSAPVPRAKRKAAEQDFNKAVGGIAQAGRTIFMPFGVDLKELTFSPQEMSYLASLSGSRDNIATIFDIPPGLLSPANVKGRTDIEQLEYVHAKYGVAPRCLRMEQRLNMDIVSEYDPRLFCAFDDPVPADKEFKLKARTADLRSGTQTINEARHEDGRPEVPWGDEPILPSNMLPLSVSVKAASRPKSDTSMPKNDGQHPLDDTKVGRQKIKEPGKQPTKAAE